MVVVLSHIVFVKSNLRFYTKYRTRRSRYLQSSFLILDAPRCCPFQAASIDVCPDEMMNELEREAPVAVLETDHSKVREHLYAVEVGSGKELAFYA